jgi:hypothetical protein
VGLTIGQNDTKPLYALIENDLRNYGNIKNVLVVEMF